MSDEEEEYDEEGEEEEEEEEGEEGDEGEEGEEDDGVDAAKKEEAVKGDISLLGDIFGYIDKTSRRICRELINEYKLKESLESREEKQNESLNADINEEESLHWSQYEDLDEAQRAHLLEKAIMILGNEQDDMNIHKSRPKGNR